MRLEEDYIRAGFFWLPDNPDKKIPGILTIKNGGEIELEIVGLFRSDKEELLGNNSYDRIAGDIEKDGLVTLDKCFYTKKSIAFGGISKSKIHVGYVLSGVAYEPGEDVLFDRFSFSTDCLNEWMSVTGIKIDQDFDQGTACIEYTRPAPICYSFKNGMSLEINFEATIPGSSWTEEVKISQRVRLTLRSAALKPLSEFIATTHKITNFLCFAIDTVVSIKDVTATCKEITFEISDGMHHPKPIKVFYRSIPFSDKESAQNFHLMLFTHKTIEENAGEIFNKWLEAYEAIAPAMSLYFSTKTGAQRYLDGKFLALAQGLETYHRRSSHEMLMDEATYSELAARLMENCPPEHADWLQGKLRYGNEISLSTRLKRVVEPFKKHLGTKTEIKRLIRDIVTTRNYLTHYSEELKDVSCKGPELLALCSKMEVIFQLHFLQVIGFTETEVDQVVNNSFSIKGKLAPQPS
ncbi:ApeA N-terminal domain 1-containing protein [Castellaniella ginsengisoli]